MKPSSERRRRLQKIANAHDVWVRDNLHLVNMRPERSHEDSDYNQHYLDLDAPSFIEEKFQNMLRNETHG